MLIAKPEAGFHETLSRGLKSCGYNPHSEGIFTRNSRRSTADWLSVTGNSYFYMVSAGVVFPDLSRRMRDALPPQQGVVPLDGIDPALLPFVMSPASRYVGLPSKSVDFSAADALTPSDGADLAHCICNQLNKALSKFHELDRAVEEVEATLYSGGMKAFLLVVAYLELGKRDIALQFAQKTLKLFRADPMRSYYANYLDNLQGIYGASLGRHG